MEDHVRAKTTGVNHGLTEDDPFFWTLRVMGASSAEKVLTERGRMRLAREIILRAAPDLSSNPACVAGHQQEPLIADVYERSLHRELRLVNTLGPQMHPTVPLLNASPDRVCINRTGKFQYLVEIKHKFTGRLPAQPQRAHYYQVQVQMEVWNVDTCVIVYSADVNDPDEPFRDFTVLRNATEWKRLEAGYREVARLVEAGRFALRSFPPRSIADTLAELHQGESDSSATDSEAACSPPKRRRTLSGHSSE